MSTKSTKGVRRLARPRPLRLGSDSDTSGEQHAPAEQELITELERLHVSLNNGNLDENVSAQIGTVCAMLMAKGAAIDGSNKEILDRYFVTLRNAAQDGRLDACSRLKLLQVVEVRSMQWKCNENVRHFYQRMIEQLEEESQLGVTHGTPSSAPSGNSSPPKERQRQRRTAHLQTSMVTASSPSLPPQPTEVLQSLGNFGKPATIPGGSILEDEVVTRSSDSGKVMPGVRDRTVQVAGPSEEAILRAQELIEDTLRRNASPVGGVVGETAASYAGATETNQAPPLMHSASMGDASVGEFSIVLNVASDTVRITGGNPGLVEECKLVLEKYFAGEVEFRDEVATEFPAQPKNYAAYASSEPIICGTGGPRLDLSGPDDLSGISDRPSSQTSSSSDETLREDGCQKPKEKPVAAQPPKHATKSASIAKNVPAQVAAKTSVPVGAPEQSEQSERSGSTSVFSAETEPPQVPFSVADPPVGSPRRSYSRDLLLHFSRSALCFHLPLEFPRLDPDLENVMVRECRRQSYTN